jgi:hypothetical protein
MFPGGLSNGYFQDVGSPRRRDIEIRISDCENLMALGP